MPEMFRILFLSGGQNRTSRYRIVSSGPFVIIGAGILITVRVRFSSGAIESSEVPSMSFAFIWLLNIEVVGSEWDMVANEGNGMEPCADILICSVVGSLVLPLVGIGRGRLLVALTAAKAEEAASV